MIGRVGLEEIILLTACKRLKSSVLFTISFITLLLSGLIWDLANINNQTFICGVDLFSCQFFDFPNKTFFI